MKVLIDKVQVIKVKTFTSLKPCIAREPLFSFLAVIVMSRRKFFWAASALAVVGLLPIPIWLVCRRNMTSRSYFSRIFYKDSNTVEHSQGTSVDKFGSTPELHSKEVEWPIVYRPEYNIGFLRLEKLHSFDSRKWEKVFQKLKDNEMLSDDSVLVPAEATEEELLRIHRKEYLKDLTSYGVVCRIAESPVPPFVYDSFLLKPLRFQTKGTLEAARLATERGWAINIGGGFHHASHEGGAGFCFYADISLAIRTLLEEKVIKNAMIIDLDAHQGNGHERDFLKETDTVYILDMFNRGIYPRDKEAKAAIRKMVELQFYMEDDEYLDLVKKNVGDAMAEFTPDLVVYNAGTDILKDDPLGLLSISHEGVVKRDEIVFDIVKKQRGIPIVMVTSGGYTKASADVIADSILNLYRQRLIGRKEEKQDHQRGLIGKEEKQDQQEQCSTPNKDRSTLSDGFVGIHASCKSVEDLVLPASADDKNIIESPSTNINADVLTRRSIHSETPENIEVGGENMDVEKNEVKTEEAFKTESKDVETEMAMSPAEEELNISENKMAFVENRETVGTLSEKEATRMDISSEVDSGKDEGNSETTEKREMLENPSTEEEEFPHPRL